MLFLNMMRYVLFLLVAPMATPTASSSADSIEFFERKIRPVLVERCYECHSAQSQKLKGDLRLDTAEGMRKGGKSGQPAIVPGSASGSLLLSAIAYTNSDLQMPPTKQLPSQVIADLAAWVEMGAPDPRTNN